MKIGIDIQDTKRFTSYCKIAKQYLQILKDIPTENLSSTRQKNTPPSHDASNPSLFDKSIDTKNNKGTNLITEILKLRRLFTDPELEYLATKNFSEQTATGLYCAKEAFFKAIGTGVKPSKLNQIEVLHDEIGAPYYNILDAGLFANHQSNLSLSISHTGGTAVAVCILY